MSNPEYAKNACLRNDDSRVDNPSGVTRNQSFFKSTEKWAATYCALSFLLYHSQQIFTKQLRQRLKLDAIIDDVIPLPYQGLSLGQRDLLPPSLSAQLLVVGWHAYILSEANHRKMAVEQRGVE